MDLRKDRCCCFSDTQHSSYASGVYTLILSACGIAYLASTIANTSHSPHHEIDNHFEYKTGSISALVFFILLLMFSLKLLYGIQTGKRLMFVPWMVCIVIIIVLQSAALFMYLLNMYDIMDRHQFGLLMIMIGMLGVHVGCFILVNTYYQVLRLGLKEYSPLVYTIM